MTNIPKKWFASKTLWVAIIQAILGVVVVLAAELPTVGVLMVAKSALDFILRFITNKPVI